jgi:transaldolase
VFRPAYDASDGVDGRVSIEVTPKLADDTEATAAEARALWWLVDRPNLFVKIPATAAGIPAIEQTLSEGISVNVTLIFALERYGEVIDAFMSGLERARSAGHDLSRLGSVASFFVSRVDTEADRRLDEIGGHDELKGKLAIANAKLAYQTYKEIFSGSEWDELEAAGASRQRCLWASTSTKNPEYRDVIYVEELIGADTVDTMPLETIRDFQDHGKVEDTLEQGVDEARQTLKAFADAGVDYDDVVATLEREGVEKFSDSFNELLKGVAQKRDKLVAA